jgi:dTDP-4-amino-4,6-dideoxygalactose transaminase
VPPSKISVFSAELAARTEDAAFEVMPERRKCANRWADAIRAVDPSEQSVRLCSPLRALESASCLRLPVRLKNPSSSEDHWKKLRRFGVESGYPRALPELDQVKPLVTNSHERFPGADTLASELVTLPTHHWVRDADIEGALALITGQPPTP